MKKISLALIGLLFPLLAHGQSFLSHPAQEQEAKRLLGLPQAKAAGVVAEKEPEERIEIEEIDFDMDGLEEIQERIEEGELNLALEMLLSLTEKQGEKRLEEMRGYLFIQTHYLLGQYKMAVQEGAHYLERFANGENFARAYYYHNLALSKLERPLVLTELVTPELFDKLSTAQGTNLREILVKNALFANDPFSALSLIEAEEGKGILKGFEPWFPQILARIENLDDLEDLASRYPQRELQSQLSLRKIHLLVKDANYQRAQEFLNQLLTESDLEAGMLSELQSLNSFITNAQEVEPYRIGVLLPFGSGSKTLQALSEEIADGLEVGLMRFSTPQKPIQLVFKDSNVVFSKEERLKGVVYGRQKTLDHIKDKVRELVVQDKVIAILGPLTLGQSQAAGIAADEYKIPLISYSLTEGIGAEHPFLFRYQKNLTEEARVMAQYALDYLGAKRFVMLYHPSELKQMTHFMKLVTDQGAEIVGMAEVQKDAVDLQPQFKAITGGFAKLTEEEIDEIEKTREVGNVVVDFDAIYAPMDPAMVNTVSNFAGLYQAEKVWILAGSELNDESNILLDQAGRIRFTDSYPISLVLTSLRPFYEAHYKAYGHRVNYQKPSEYTLFAYESLQILAALLENEKHHSREALKSALMGLQEFPVLTGQVSVAPGQEIQKELKILKVEGRITQEAF